MEVNRGGNENEARQTEFDTNSFVVQNLPNELRFARAASKHRISREVVQKVITNPVVVAQIGKGIKGDNQIIFLGDDPTGAPVEVMAVELEAHLLVIHAMPLRNKWRYLYEIGE